jgi:hypothetical protein
MAPKAILSKQSVKWREKNFINITIQDIYYIYSLQMENLFALNMSEHGRTKIFHFFLKNNKISQIVSLRSSISGLCRSLKVPAKADL